MSTIAELETVILNLKQEEKALQLQLKAVRGKIAAAQLELMGACKAAEATAPAAAARDRSRSRGSEARASSDDGSSSDDEAEDSPSAPGADDVVAAGVEPPPDPPALALVPHRGAGRGRARGRGRAQHPRRPPGRCRACWYRELGVPGGSAHTADAGCDRGGGV